MPAASKAVFAVLALGAGSVLGYNWVTTGCPSGVCPSERAAAANIVNASLTTDTAADSCDDAAKADCATACETTAELPACCAALGEPACGDASLCADMPAPDQAHTAATAGATTETDACCALTEAAQQAEQQAEQQAANQP